MSKESIRLPQSTFVVEMQHKYAVGDKVRVTRRHTWLAGVEGEIAALVPYTFLAPGYYVMIDGSKLALSELSLERIETPTPECSH